MKNPLSKTPFLFLLIPLIAGILLQYYLRIEYLSIAFSLTGIIAMLFSYLIVEEKQFSFRWLFGVGVAFFLIGVGISTTYYSQQRSSFIYSGQIKTYEGIVTDTPQDKPRSVAYKVFLPKEQKYIVCYFGLDSSRRLEAGDKFIFEGKIQPFKNLGDFDYATYMYNQNIVGSAYVPPLSWEDLHQTAFSFKYIALRYRQKIMDFYKSLHIDSSQAAILSALTLGYQNDLSDDIKQGFRTTGTVHVLSVSGLHVGIIYCMIGFLLSFIRKETRYYWIKPSLIIILLWVYTFVTGLPVSVIRASAMLTVFCFSEILGRKSFSVHALYITAFFILLISPFSIFDISFQLSFLSVLSILYLQPQASALLTLKNKYLKSIWLMFTLSIVAQLATFPLCLYYFGTFPTYFFITNMLIVPLVTLITYSVGIIIFAKMLSILFPTLIVYICYLPEKILVLLVSALTSAISFFERLPLALIEDAKISLVSLILIYFIILGTLIFLLSKKAKGLIFSLASVFILFTVQIYRNISL